MLQDINNLESFFKKDDPWGYEKNIDDKKRKDILFGEIPPKTYQTVLDIGCGHGYITRDLPGKNIIGVDISKNAIRQAKKFTTKNVSFLQASIFELVNIFKNDKFNLIIITGVLYPQYIGNSYTLVYQIIDQLLCDNGILLTVHINDWYRGRFPFLLSRQIFYPYREYIHNLEVYIK